jgi:hypothetical protein
MDIGSAHESVWQKFSSGKIKQMGPDLKKISGLPLTGSVQKYKMINNSKKR